MSAPTPVCGGAKREPAAVKCFLIQTRHAPVVHTPHIETAYGPIVRSCRVLHSPPWLHMQAQPPHNKERASSWQTRLLLSQPPKGIFFFSRLRNNASIPAMPKLVSTHEKRRIHRGQRFRWWTLRVNSGGWVNLCMMYAFHSMLQFRSRYAAR